MKLRSLYIIFIGAILLIVVVGLIFTNLDTGSNLAENSSQENISNGLNDSMYTTVENNTDNSTNDSLYSYDNIGTKDEKIISHLPI